MLQTIEVSSRVWRLCISIINKFSLTHFGLPFIGQGARTDRCEIFSLLEQGKTDLEIMEADFSGYARLRNAIADYRSCKTPERTTPLEVFLFYGEPGSGKSQFAHQQLGKQLYKLPVSDSMWLTPAICGKKNILIDEFKAKATTRLANLLQMLDEYPIEFQSKGSFRWFMPDIVVITTNVNPHDWYNYDRRSKEKRALFRRFDNGGVYRFDKNAEQVPRPYQINIWDTHAFDYPDSEEDINQAVALLLPLVQQTHQSQEIGFINQ